LGDPDHVFGKSVFHGNNNGHIAVVVIVLRTVALAARQVGEAVDMNHGDGWW